MDDYIWKMRGESFLRSLKVAVEELQRNTSILKSETAMDKGCRGSVVGIDEEVL